MSRASAAAASLALATALAAVAFVAGGGTALGRMASVEIALIVGAGAALALMLLSPGTGRLHGIGPLSLLALFTALTAASLGWSIAPDATLEETARVLAYLAVFAVAIAAANRAPHAAPAVLGGVLLATVVVCGWALTTRVFPGSLAEFVIGSRLGAPFDYWNALGAMAAMAVPAALWLGSRRGGASLLTALAYPATGVLLLTVLLTQSRGALAAMVIGVILWLALVPLRLRTAALIILPALAVAPIAIWALFKDAFSATLASLAEREAIAGSFGAMLVVLCAVLLLAGLFAGRVDARRELSPIARRRAGLVLVVAACLLPLAGVVAVAVGERGIGGTVAEGVDSITSESAAPPPGAQRLGSVSSARGSYWRQAAQVFEERRLHGVGANAFELAALRYRPDSFRVRHAHGFPIQTLADLGILGLALGLALLVAWLAAARTSTGLDLRGGERREWPQRRVELVALALVAVVFGVHSAIDWTWFILGPSVAALVAAGFVAGHGPPGREPGPPGSTGSLRARTRALRATAGEHPERILAGAAVLLVCALCSWVAWLPERTASASDRAQRLAERGDLEGAVEAARSARASGPYSADPLYARAVVLIAGERPEAAYRAYEQAVIEHPRDPETWLELARYELVLDLPERALATLSGALAVDPRSKTVPELMAQAQAALAPPPAPPPAPAPAPTPTPPPAPAPTPAP